MASRRVNNPRNFRQFMLQLEGPPRKKFPPVTKDMLAAAKGYGRFEIEVGAIWDRAAPSFRAVMNSKQNRTDILREMKALIENVRILSTDKILSIGTNIAFVESYLALKYVPNGRVRIVDISKKMVELAEETKRISGAQNLDIFHGHGTKLEIQDNSQNKVLVYANDANEKRDYQILREARRVLKTEPESRLIEVYANILGTPDSRPSKIKNAGFKIVNKILVSRDTKSNKDLLMVIAQPI